MKRIFIICALSSLSLASIAQCNKNIVFNAGKADFVDSLGKSIDTKQGKITVTLTKTDFVLMHDDEEDDALRGHLKNVVCDWKDAFRNGKTTFEFEFIEKNGEKNDAVVNIEGKNGHLLILVDLKTRGMILNIVPDSYHEVKE